MIRNPTDAEVKPCCLNCIYFSVCKQVAKWKAERDEDGFYPNCTKCGEFMGNWAGRKERGHDRKVNANRRALEI